MPLHHKLYPGTDDHYYLPFIIGRLREELKSVTSPPYSSSLSSVPLIWDFLDYFNTYNEAITSFLSTEFHTTPQNIEEQLTSSNRTDIIMDVVWNTMSFESPVVIYISCGGGTGRHYYNTCTRARVALTIIDVSGYDHKWFSDSNSTDKVLWKPDPNDNDNNTFIRYTCTCDRVKFDYCMC